MAQRSSASGSAIFSLSSPETSSLPRAVVAPWGEVDLVALGVGECPPVGCVCIVHDAAPGCEGGGQASFDLVAGYIEVEVDGVALRAGRVDLLDLDVRAERARVAEISVLDGSVAEHGLPESSHGSNIDRVDRYLEALYGRRIGEDPKFAGGRRDSACQRHIPFADVADVGTVQAKGHASVAQVDVGIMVRRIGEAGDRRDERRPGQERAGREVGASPIAHDAPIFGALSFAELSR